MDIRQLKAFVAIAEEKTFTAGAKRMNVTQAAVSMQIRQLEKEIDLPLFNRTPRRVILTQAGEALLPRARKILREHDTALEELAEIAGAEHGRLRIGSASAVFTTFQLPEILENLKNKFPQAEISVVSGTSLALVEKITHGEIDIAFVSLPVENSNVDTELLFSDEIVAIAHPTHSFAKERIVNAKKLAKQPLILGEKGGNTRRMIDDYFENANVKPNIVMELSRQEGIDKMVENNMGIGLSGSKNVAEKVSSKKLVAIPIRGAKIKWELGLARIRGGYFSPISQEFFELCKKNFKEREKKFSAAK